MCTQEGQKRKSCSSYSDELAKHKDELLKRDLSNTENYDKAILTLSSAGLGFSLVAIRSIVPLESAVFVYLVISGWSLLLISIIICLVAYLISNKAIAIELKKIGSENAANQENRWKKINGILNISSGATFIIAMILIVIFVILNVLKTVPQANHITSCLFR